MTEPIRQPINPNPVSGSQPSPQPATPSQNSDEMRLEAERLQQQLDKSLRSADSRLSGANRNVQDTQQELQNIGLFGRFGGQGKTLERQLEAEKNYADKVTQQRQELLQTQQRVQKLIKEKNYGQARAVMEGKEKEYLRSMKYASQSAQAGYQEASERNVGSEKLLETTENGMRTTRDGLIVAGAVVATGGAAAAGYGVVATAALGTAGGTAVGALSNATEGVGHGVRGNKQWGDAFTDAAKQTGKDALTSAQVGISGGAAVGTARIAGGALAKTALTQGTQQVLTGMAAGSGSGLVSSSTNVGTRIAQGEDISFGQAATEIARGTIVGTISGGMGAKGQGVIDKMTAAGTNIALKEFGVRAAADVMAPTAVSLGAQAITGNVSKDQAVSEVGQAILGGYMGHVTAKQQSGNIPRQDSAEGQALTSAGTAATGWPTPSVPRIKPPVPRQNSNTFKNQDSAFPAKSFTRSSANPEKYEVRGGSSVINEPSRVSTRQARKNRKPETTDNSPRNLKNLTLKQDADFQDAKGLVNTQADDAKKYLSDQTADAFIAEAKEGQAMADAAGYGDEYRAFVEAKAIEIMVENQKTKISIENTKRERVGKYQGERRTAIQRNTNKLNKEFGLDDRFNKALEQEGFVAKNNSGQRLGREDAEVQLANEGLVMDRQVSDQFGGILHGQKAWHEPGSNDYWTWDNTGHGNGQNNGNGAVNGNGTTYKAFVRDGNNLINRGTYDSNFNRVRD